MNVGNRTVDNFQIFIGLYLLLMLYLSSNAVASLSPEDGTLASNRRGRSRYHSHNRTKTRHNASLVDAVVLPHRLIEGSVEVIVVNVTDDRWRTSNELEAKLSHFFVERYVVTSRNPRVAKILNSSFVLATAADDQVFKEQMRSTEQLQFPYWEDEILDDGDVSALRVKISGRRVGKTVVDVSVYGFAIDSGNNTTSALKPIALPTNSSGTREGESGPNKEMRLIISFDVCVLRRSLYGRLSFAFTIFVAIIAVATTFLIGTQLDWKIIVKELKKPASLLIGVGLEFILMPLVAFVLALTILRGNYGWQLACLAIGACPGGGHSPFWTMMLDGNLDLAVAMSFIASVSALGILPFWLFTLGRVFYGGRVTVPYMTITGSLFALVCPIFFGLAFKRFLPVWAERIGRILKPVTVVSFIIVGIFGCGVNSYVFALLDWRHFICGMLLPYAGYALTYVLSRWLFHRSHADSLAIAVENGCLNVAVPVVLLQLSLTQPDADLSLVVPVGMVICASWPLWIYFIYLVIKKRLTRSVACAENEKAAGNAGLEKDIENSGVTPSSEITSAASSGDDFSKIPGSTAETSSGHALGS